MLTIGYIESITADTIFVRYTEHDSITYAYNTKSTCQFQIGEIVLIDIDGKTSIENIKKITECKNIEYEVVYSYQHLLYNIGLDKYETENFYKELKTRKISQITMSILSHILEDDYFTILVNYVNEFNIYNFSNNFRINIKSYLHRTNDGDEDERYELYYPPTESSYIKSFYPQYGGWSQCCINNYPEQRPNETYKQAVTRLETEIKSNLIKQYSKEKHLIHLIQECILIKDEYQREKNNIYKAANKYLGYPIPDFV